jgi:hypothetical protein
MKTRKRKDEFADLDSDWKSGIASMSTDEVNARIAEIAKAEQEMQATKKEDEDLNSLREQLKAAAQGYREHTKLSKLRIKFCMRVLADRGQG